jgi:polyprenyl P-hydroxybenzoate/phenylacrylic acid decarboxylase-like protein
MAKRIVVGISGASGVTYGVRMLELLRKTEFETHLIISQAGKLNIEIETSYKPGEVEAMADFTYDHKDMAAALASGSFLTEGMVVIPCTIKRKTQAGSGGQRNPIAHRASSLDDYGRRNGGPFTAAGAFILSPAEDH